MKKYAVSVNLLTAQAGIIPFATIVEANDEFIAQTKGFALIQNEIRDYNENNPDDRIVRPLNKVQYQVKPL